MTWVKICGVTNLEDALVAVDAGADAVGFVFYEKSPRSVTAERAREIVEKLPEEIEKVGVFVGATEETLIGTSNDVGLTVAQVYPGANHQLPDLRDEFLRNAQCDVIVALPAQSLDGGRGQDPNLFILSHHTLARVLAVLVDSGSADRPGGTGKTFNWDHARFIRQGMKRLDVPWIVAGGLVPENVGDAIGIFRPWGVDVASGVEASPGRKDPEKVRAFIRAVREIDRKAG
jgi:phosphoribosylanthranilate isomerase